MKGRPFRRVAWLLFGLGLVSLFATVNAVSAATLADSYLSYEGKDSAGQALFILDSDDLLANFKEVMPGDEVEQGLTITNNSTKVSELLLSIVTTDELDVAFLEQLTLTMTQGQKELYKGLISEVQKGSAISFGTLQPKESVRVELHLAVPLSLDNRFNGYVSQSQWTFLATDTGTTPPTKEPEKEQPEKNKPSVPVKPQAPTRPGGTSRGNLPQAGETVASQPLILGGLVILLAGLGYRHQRQRLLKDAG